MALLGKGKGGVQLNPPNIPPPPPPPLKTNKVIYICAPLKGDVAANIARAREHCKALIEAGYMPYAPHVALDGVLDDNSPQERETALKIGVEMVKRCNELWVFGNVISEGMKTEIEIASRENIPIKFYGAKAAIHTVAEWIEAQLSVKSYNAFVADLTAEGDNEHPSYDEWRQELEPEIRQEAEELKSKGVLD